MQHGSYEFNAQSGTNCSPVYIKVKSLHVDDTDLNHDLLHEVTFRAPATNEPLFTPSQYVHPVLGQLLLLKKEDQEKWAHIIEHFMSAVHFTPLRDITDGLGSVNSTFNVATAMKIKLAPQFIQPSVTEYFQRSPTPTQSPTPSRTQTPPTQIIDEIEEYPSSSEDEDIEDADELPVATLSDDEECSPMVLTEEEEATYYPTSHSVYDNQRPVDTSKQHVFYKIKQTITKPIKKQTAAEKQSYLQYILKQFKCT